MTVAPPLYVAAPPVPASSRYGLLSAADSVIEPNPLFRNGIEWQPNPCGPATEDPSDCGNNVTRTTTDGIPVRTSGPIVLYAGFTCRPIGVSEADLLARARLALTQGEAAALEAAIWTEDAPAAQSWMPQPQRLMVDDPAPTGLVATEILAGTAVPLVKGLALIEQHLHTEYGGIGVVHAPREVITYATRDRLAAQEVNRLLTPGGHRWAFGNYPLTGPDGEAAEADTAWLVATGAVQIRRSDVTVRPGSLAEALNRSTNDARFVADRTYVASWECVTAAVLVSLA